MSDQLVQSLEHIDGVSVVAVLLVLELHQTSDQHKDILHYSCTNTLVEKRNAELYSTTKTKIFRQQLLSFLNGNFLPRAENGSKFKHSSHKL